MEETIVKDNTTSQGTEEEQRKKYGFVVQSARKVQDHERKTSSYIIENLITPGLNILAGPSKWGKSWLCLNIALSIVQGKKLWGRNTVKGGVLYMALEDNDDRMAARLNRILNYEDAPEELDITYDACTIKDIVRGVSTYIREHKDIKLIIIDVLQKIRGEIPAGKTEYGNDYDEIGMLKKLADRCGVAILLVTHTRKTRDKFNRMNQISGGVGVLGAADTLLMLSGAEGMDMPKTVYIKGRDMMEQAIQVKFNKNTCLWGYVGTEEELMTKEAEKRYASNLVVKTVKALLEKNGGEWQGTCSDLLECGQKETGTTIAKSSSALGRMFRELNPLFFSKDSIVHIEPDKNGGITGRIHKFYIEKETSNSLSDNIKPVESYKCGFGTI